MSCGVELHGCGVYIFEILFIMAFVRLECIGLLLSYLMLSRATWRSVRAGVVFGAPSALEGEGTEQTIPQCLGLPSTLTFLHLKIKHSLGVGTGAKLSQRESALFQSNSSLTEAFILKCVFNEKRCYRRISPPNSVLFTN